MDSSARKAALCLLAVAMVASCVACTAPAQPTSTAAPEAAATTVPLKSYRIVQVQLGPRGIPFSDLVFSGLERLQQEMGADRIELKLIEVLDLGECKEQVRAAAEMGYNPVVTVYDPMAEAVLEVAPSFPDTQFICVDTLVLAELPNVRTVVIDPQEACFIAGVVAAKTTKTKKVGFVGSAEGPGIWRFCAGFSAGVKYADPAVELITVWSGTATDVQKGLEVASMVFNQGADVIIHACNKCGLGVIQAAAQLEKQAMGVDMWQGDVAPGFVPWSALKDAGSATYVATKEGLELPFESGQMVYDRKSGAALYDKRDFDALSPELQEMVLDIEDKMVEGTLVAPGTKEELAAFTDQW